MSDHTRMLQLCFFVSIVLSNGSLIKANNCSFKLEQHKCIVDCASLGWTRVPRITTCLVTYLALTNNYITRLSTGTFVFFQHLLTLLLNQNRISTIEKGAFSGLSKLRRLHLQGNQIHLSSPNFPANLFQDLVSLVYLNIGHNPFNKNDSIYPSKALSRITNLQELTMDLYQTPVFGNEFARLNHLRAMYFTSCLLMNLTNLTFVNFKTNPIQVLSLRECSAILLVETGFLIPFSHLRVLDLSGSRLRLQKALSSLYPLQNKTMDAINMYNVEHISYGDVPFTHPVLDNESMRYLKEICVKYFNIGHNKISGISMEAVMQWKHIECLTALILKENFIALNGARTHQETLIFIWKSTNLQTLDFSYDYGVFPKDNARKDIHIEGLWTGGRVNNSSCKIQTDTNRTEITKSSTSSTYDIHNACRQEVVIPFPKTLHTIRFDHIMANELHFYGNRTFKVVGGQIEVFDISYMPLEGFDIDMELDFKKIDFVNLSGLDMRKLNSVFIKVFSGTNTLQMRDINLDKVLNSHVRLIDLSFNRLVGLNQSVMDWLDNIQHGHGNMSIFLEGNILQCSCLTRDFVMWLSKTSVTLDHHGDYRCFLENGQVSNTSTVLRDYSVHFEKCVSKFWIEFSISAMSVLLLVVITGIVVYRYRWRIRYWCYRTCSKASVRAAMADHLREVCTFDAFVAYSGEDYRWVFDVLRTRLETERGVKLYLHDRDFKIGTPIGQNIVDRMRESMTIIFNISPGYLQATWCEFELQMAAMDIFERGEPEMLIVIFHEEADPRDMPRALRDIWDKITCIEVPNRRDFADDNLFIEAEDLFWERLHSGIINASL
ncbi:toll-like receptor 4 [Mizuhopecten yessoensis]|uniref:toll-like receptor 4 n=1 Tax=Mizuhopecten yessoensis TaxID=6573 RepID=UPI000B457D74|nr:toll-like receptor 4 [Mizuhopecten yessoensis]